MNGDESFSPIFYAFYLINSNNSRNIILILIIVVSNSADVTYLNSVGTYYKSRVIKMIKVGLDAGHGGFGVTPGKRTPDGEYEWDFNNKVAKAFASELALYQGVISKRFDDPSGKRDVPLKERTDGANSWGADYYISFHHNANTAEWGNWTGVETFVYIGNKSTESGKLAQAIHPAVVKAYGLRDRGIKEANLHIVREFNGPAILIEGGFMDSTIDIKKLRDDLVLTNAGKMIAQAFAEYVGLKRITFGKGGKVHE